MIGGFKTSDHHAARLMLRMRPMRALQVEKMAYLKFDIRKLQKLNDPARLEQLDPRLMWEALGNPEARVMVEIGAGTGFFARRFCRLTAGAVVYACDMEDEMIDWMKANVAEVAEGCVVPVKSEEALVPLDDEIADLVYMINLHHELADPGAIYREAHRLLESGGQILVVDWKKEETPHGPPVRVRVPVEVLAAHVTDAGFTDVTAHASLPWHNMVTGLRQ